MKKFLRMPAVVFASLLTVSSLSVPIDAQTTTRRPVSGFNVFSVEQDVEIGRQSAAEAEQQLKLLNDRNTDVYLTRIVQRLAAYAPGAKYPYSVKAVNATDINAFALPGGPLYVNRGLITAARSEAELAGVIAHEMSHIALRHGTNQASKAYLGQAGLSLLGGLIGSRSTTSQVVTAIGGFGLNAAFLKFSRDDESDADAAGARMMASAGYNPVAMADFFAVLRQQQGRDPGKVETFFSSHPPPVNREARIRTLASTLTIARTSEVGGFANLKGRLTGTAVATAPTQYPVTSSAAGTVVTTTETIRVNVPAPSSRFAQFQHRTGFFTVQYPDNWRSYAPATGYAVSIAPPGGVAETSDGQQAMVYGFIVNHYEPFDGATERLNQSFQRSYAPFEDRTKPRGALEDATDDLVRQVLRSNSYLSTEFNSAKAEVIDGMKGYSVLLNGRSPLTNEDERVTLYTRGLTDGHVVYALCVAPSRDATVSDRTCLRMMRSLIIDDNAAHRSGTRPPA